MILGFKKSISLNFNSPFEELRESLIIMRSNGRMKSSNKKSPTVPQQPPVEHFSSFSLRDGSSSGVDFDSNSNGSYDPSTSSSSASSDVFWDSDLVQMPLRKGSNKQKKVVASAGTVANVIGKDYVRSSPCRAGAGGGGNKGYGCFKIKGIYSNKAASNEEAEHFLCSLLGDDCHLSMAVVRDVLCQCGYDVDKALDVLLDLSASTHNMSNDGSAGDYSQSYQEFDDSGDKGIGKYQLPNRISGSTFNFSVEAQQTLLSLGYDYRKYSEVLVGPKKQNTPAITDLNLPQNVLESLFSIPKSSVHVPDCMNWKNVVKKMESFGPGLNSYTDSFTELRQNTEYAKGEDYALFRKPATQHYDAMKFCYQKAATAYSSGQRSYAAILSDQGRIHNKFAHEADEKASQEIFLTRNKAIQNTVTIDLHGQHVKQAIKLLKVHLVLFTTYVPSVQGLRVITGCGTGGVGKGKLKQSVVGLVEKGGLEWREENQGSMLIMLDGQRNFDLVDSEDESE